VPDELSGKKILLVDDDRDILQAMEMVLKDAGAEVYTAMDGNSAVAQTDKQKPDLVVLDQMLPKRSGFLVMEKLNRTRKQGLGPHVIMITANEGQRHKLYAQSLGVEAYLNKPFRMEKLVEQIKNVFEEAE
jgi:DNA-binding response OmpR family regulator